MSSTIFYIPDNKHPAEANMTKRNVLLTEMIVHEGLGKVATGRAASEETAARLYRHTARAAANAFVRSNG